MESSVEELIRWLSVDNGSHFQWGIFIALLLGGLGFPIPEDLPLILSGIAAARGVVELDSIALICYIGVIIGDQVLYFLGFLFGKKLMKKGIDSPLLPHLTQEWVDYVRVRWRGKRYLLIIMARHLFPFRAVTFISAGALHVPYIDFLVADLFAALLSVTIMLGIGYFIGEQLSPEVIKHLIDQAHVYTFAICLIGVLFWLYRRQRQKRIALNEANSATEL